MRAWILLREWIAYRRARRRWRDAMTLLTLVLICVLLNMSFFCCGVVGYTLQRIGLLPTATPTPIENPAGDSVALPAAVNWRLANGNSQSLILKSAFRPLPSTFSLHFVSLQDYGIM